MLFFIFSFQVHDVSLKHLQSIIIYFSYDFHFYHIRVAMQNFTTGIEIKLHISSTQATVIGLRDKSYEDSRTHSLKE